MHQNRLATKELQLQFHHLLVKSMLPLLTPTLNGILIQEIGSSGHTMKRVGKGNGPTRKLEPSELGGVFKMLQTSKVHTTSQNL